MITQIKTELICLGDEPAEVLGFQTEEELEAALSPLMEDITVKETIAA